jgi:diguanylate cyclase (GGDEF)-like protein
MLHIPTLLFALSLTDVVLAATLLVALGPGARGARPWSMSLVLQAISFAIYALRDPMGEIGLVAAVNGVAALSFTMQAEGVLAFHRRTFRRAWHAIAPLATAVVFASLTFHPRVRLLANGLLCTGAMVAIAWVAGRLHEGGRLLGVRLLRVGLVAGAALTALRAVAGVLDPQVAAGLRGWSGFGVSITLLADAVTIVSSLGFLLMHRERQEQSIEALAMTDPLTGAYNRRSLFDIGEKELARAIRTGTAVSVVILDLDHFKRVNDTHGHVAGDAVLTRFVDVVRGCLRRGDLLTRYGGEEFCVLLPGEASTPASAVAERIRAAVEASVFVADGRSISVTTSAGVASLRPGATPDLSSLVSRADEALYVAKRDGRNRVVVAS